MSSLYLHHFGLIKSPFQITPDTDFFFAGGRRGDVLAALLHVAAHDEGIMLLVAEIGSGKTLLARLMISRLDPKICAVYLANPCFSRNEIIAAIGRDLGLTDLTDSKEGKLAALQQELLRRHALDQRVVLVIDEAHAMPAESLEEVRLLSNLETGRHKLINIMLFGQPELDVLLAEPRLRQVRDRVIHRFALQSLQSMETSAYVDHRLRAAGWQGAGLFAPDAMNRLITAAQGRARRINLLADKALLAAYAQGSLTVELSHVNHAMHELPLEAAVTKGRFISQQWHVLGLGLTMAVVLTFVAEILLSWYRSTPIAGSAATASHQQMSVNVSPTAVGSSVVPTSAATPRAISAAATRPPQVVPAALLAPVVQSVAMVEKQLLPDATVSPHITQPLKQAVSAVTTAPLSTRQRPQISAHVLTIFNKTKNRLRQTPLSGYTIQLVAMETSDRLDQYLRQIAESLGAMQIYGQFSQYNGKIYIAVYVGDFPTALACARAIENLPMPMRSNRPMVRSWVKVKQEQTL